MIQAYYPHINLSSFNIESHRLLQHAEGEETAYCRDERIVTNLFFKYGKVIAEGKGPNTNLYDYFFNKEKKKG